MNWSVYSEFVGDVFGAPLAIEGLAAFFLESTMFLGLWIFGCCRGCASTGDGVAVRARQLAFRALITVANLDAAPGSARRCATAAPSRRASGSCSRTGLRSGPSSTCPRRAHDGSRRRPRGFLLALRPRPQRRDLPARRQARPDRPRAGLRGEPPRRQLPGRGRHRVPTDEDRGDRGAVGHGAAGRLLRLQIGGFSEDDQTPSFDIEIPKLLSLLATGPRRRGAGQATSLKRVRAGSTAWGTTSRRSRPPTGACGPRPTRGTLVFAVAALGAFLMWRGRLERTRWFLWAAVGLIALPYVPALAGWVLSEVGRQPWIVQGSRPPMPTPPAWGRRPSRSASASSRSPTGCSPSSTSCSCATTRRSTRRGSTARATRPRPPALGHRMALDLCLWFLIIAFFWAGYFLLEGFDFGVGMLLPFLPRDERERRGHVRVDRPGLGRQRGLARRRRRGDLRRLPELVRTMFLAGIALLALAFLIVRVVS